ncbi:DUF5994 family protein [Streptomyces sp. NPDC056224]|uniref:DUF5994 family protein n=1 Tax=Streptomyces sp. NPDC056224 TaxID=3345750 RepID=UPI0035DE9788
MRPVGQAFRAHAIKPGTARLRLETTPSWEGLLDGAWWPRTRDIEAELPALIGVVTEHLGPITRVGMDASARNEQPNPGRWRGAVVGTHAALCRRPRHRSVRRMRRNTARR